LWETVFWQHWYENKKQSCHQNKLNLECNVVSKVIRNGNWCRYLQNKLNLHMSKMLKDPAGGTVFY
jgi:hypothetical protein